VPVSLLEAMGQGAEPTGRSRYVQGGQKSVNGRAARKENVENLGDIPGGLRCSRHFV
jgi:hypothetical protein